MDVSRNTTATEMPHLLNIDFLVRFRRNIQRLEPSPAFKDVPPNSYSRVLAQNRTDLSDDPGNIAVTHVNQIAFERRLHVDAIHMQQSRRVFVQDPALHQVLSSGGFEQD